MELSPRETPDASYLPWFRTNRRTTAACAVVLMAALFTLRLVMDDPNDAVGLLFAFPVAFVAVSFGRAGGLLAAGMSSVLLWLALTITSESLSAMGWTTRLVTLVLTGLLVGDATERLRRATAAARRLDQEEQRRREAIEINDSIVQGLVLAKWLLEEGSTDEALNAVAKTLATAKAMVSQLLVEEVRPGDLVRRAPVVTTEARAS